MNQEQLGKHIIQCFRCATHHICVFNMACAGACKSDGTPFPTGPGSGFSKPAVSSGGGI